MTRIAAAALIFAGAAFGVTRAVAPGGHASAGVAPPHASNGPTFATAHDAGSLGSTAAIVHLDLSTTAKVGSFGVTGLGSVDVYRGRTIDRKQECLLIDARPVDGVSCLDGSLFGLHAAAFVVLGIGGTEAAARREIVAGVVGPATARVDAMGAAGARAVPINARGAFVYAPPDGTPRDEWPTRLELRDSGGRLLDALAVNAR